MAWKVSKLLYRVLNFFQLLIEPPVNRFAAGRRKSVFAEQYDPEEDNDDEEANKVTHPKTDEQRSRLGDSVKNILLFRALDLEQVSATLDFMLNQLQIFSFADE